MSRRSDRPSRLRRVQARRRPYGTAVAAALVILAAVGGPPAAASAPPSTPTAQTAETASVLPPCDSDIDFAELVTCNFDSPGTVHELTFRAAAGDRIRVRAVVTSGAVNPTTSILRGGTVVCSATFSDESTCPIATGGTHTLKIDAGGTGTGKVTTMIQRLNDPVGCTNLPYGISGKTGKINKPVLYDCWTHDATSGERWRIRVVETAGAGSLTHEVIRPDGTTMCGVNGNTESTCLLDASGPFRVIVEASGGIATADYRVLIERYPGPTGCDEGAFAKARTAKVSAAGAIACVTFDGTAGNQIRVRTVTSGGAWNPMTDVVAPDGSTVCGPTFSDVFTCALTATGEHTVVVRDGAGTGQATGEARLFVQRLDDPAKCTTIKSGVAGKTGSIGTGVEIDCFQMPATAGDRWRVRVVETGGSASLVHEVIRPNGTTVCGTNGNTESTCALDANGKTRVLVMDQAGASTGDYRVVVEKFPKPKGCAAMDPGASGTVEVTKPGAFACVKMAGKAGDQMRVRVVSDGGAWNPMADIVAPDGSTVCGPTFTDQFTCALTAKGSHVVFVRDGSGTGAATGSASVFVQRLNDPAGCVSLPYGTDGKTGSINDAVEIDCYTQKAKAGQRWRVRVVETGGSASLVHEVVRPDGTAVCGTNGNTESTCLLDANGPFRVLVEDSNGTSTGTYRIVLERFPNPSGCSAMTVGGAALTGDITLAGALACGTFSGKAGDVMHVTVLSTGGAWNPTGEVLRTDGTTLCGPTFSDTFDCTLTTNGTHTLIVRDGGGIGAALGSYSLAVAKSAPESRLPR